MKADGDRQAFHSSFFSHCMTGTSVRATEGSIHRRPVPCLWPSPAFLWASPWDWIEPGRGCQGGLRQEAGGEEVASGRPGGRPMGKPNGLSPGVECGKSGWKLVYRSEARADGRMPDQCGAYGGYSTSRAQWEGSRCAQPAPKLPLHHPCIWSLSHWHWLSKADGSLEWRLTTGNQDRDWVRVKTGAVTLFFFHCIIFQLISSSVMKL